MCTQVTTSRMLLLPSFTSTIYEDEFLLIVAADKPPSFLDKVVRPFVDTLTPGAWAMVGAVVACTKPPTTPPQPPRRISCRG